jgi:hypothetical protein
MYACKIETINSKPYIAKPNVNQAAPIGALAIKYSTPPG